MRSGAIKPGLIVDIKKIAEMTTIQETSDGGFRVGAAVPGAVLAEHRRFAKVWPGVLEAVNLIGSTQIQGRASAVAICAMPRRPATACPRWSQQVP
jgi:carbon-monoxide dehydrogenase medium subunit